MGVIRFLGSAPNRTVDIMPVGSGEVKPCACSDAVLLREILLIWRSAAVENRLTLESSPRE